MQAIDTNIVSAEFSGEGQTAFYLAPKVPLPLVLHQEEHGKQLGNSLFAKKELEHQLQHQMRYLTSQKPMFIHIEAGGTSTLSIP